MRKSQKRGYVCIRSLFGLLNGLFWILGGGVVGIAIWLRISYSGFVSLLPQHELLSLDSVGLIIGAVLFLVAFCGLIGAWFMSPCLLISYFILISILCGAELVCGIFGVLYREIFSASLQQELLTGIQAHYNTSKEYTGITFAWDHIQYQLSCCGVQHYEDWFNISAWPGNFYVPHSCCIPSFQYMSDCGQLEEVSMWFPSGCYNKAQIWLKERIHLVGIIGFVVGVIQIFGLISSMILFCFTRRRAGFKTYTAVKSQSFAV
ncbi:tetraspanin-9-like isoform X1 [Daphnia pulex]|uniref:tetraspanin-9-like isoform X1 n=1 Tax=Daphnia pulex TaxID=6669 RepID=UPI001EDF5233|nr:tetraspanin-9-like isoform X1 [Daphnia pulex]XP_046639774.1 tetraspanin-9-like isoform X1 [Daphnia pulicaria]